MLNITLVVGNPKPASRTLSVGQTLIEKLLAGAEHSLQVIDLAEYSAELFEWPSAKLAELNETVARSDLAVFASPTYKATYTGLLKAFLDRYPAGALAGVVAIPVMTGADLTHSMGPDVHLRPLLVELGATVPTRGMYFVTAHMDRLDEVVDGWVADARSSLARTERVAGAVLVHEEANR